MLYTTDSIINLSFKEGYDLYLSYRPHSICSGCNLRLDKFICSDDYHKGYAQARYDTLGLHPNAP